MAVSISGTTGLTGVAAIDDVSSTELGYLDGVTSAVQGQLDGKQAAASTGLVLVSPSSIANSGGSASSTGGTTTFTGVTSVSLNNVFSGDYENYRVLIANENSASADRYFRLRGSGTDNTGVIYNRQQISGNGASANAARQGDANAWNLQNQSANQGQSISATFFRPAEAAWTAGEYFMTRDPATPICYVGYLSHRTSTAYDGLTFYTNSGTMTGTIRVYGYQGA